MKKKILLKRNNAFESLECVISLKDPKGVEKVKAILLEKINQKFHIRSQDSSVVYFTRARYIEGLLRCAELL